MKYKTIIFTVSIVLSSISIGSFAMTTPQSEADPVETIQINSGPYSKISEADPMTANFDVPSSLGDDKVEVPVTDPNLSDNSEENLTKCNATLSRIITMSSGLTLVSSSEVESVKSGNQTYLSYKSNTLRNTDNSEQEISVECTVLDNQVNVKYKKL
ncbi:MAG: hypothetical protein ACJA0H_000990 [Francisellaceae bacterium]|jgi:hypothetical protein